MTRLALLTALLLTLTAAVVAGGNREDRSGYDVRPGYGDLNDYGRFSSAERNLIRAWMLETERRAAVKQPPAGLPPGLEKKVARGKELPPGWQKKLARGERLDRESYGWGRALPDDLLRQLPPAPPGSEILRIEDQIIRLDAATRTILDVFGLGGGH